MTAQELRVGSGRNEFKSSVLLGVSLPDDLKALITSRKNTLEIGKLNEAIGFSLIGNGENPPTICYSCDNEEQDDVLEKMSFAIHTFKWLEIDSVIIIDGVSSLGKINNESSIVRIDDHINMTGINPLDYWMMVDEPKEFFLDPKSLYCSDNPGDYQSVIHLASNETISDEVLIKAKESGAGTFGRSIVPESLIAGYLGMSVRAYGLVDNNSGDEENKLSDEILGLIRFDS